MEVTRYLFQSPYSSQIQIGRPDVNSSTSGEGDSELIKSTNQTMKEAQSFQASQTKEVTPTVNSNSLLDVVV